MSGQIQHLLTRCRDEYQQRSRDLEFQRGLGKNSEGRKKLFKDMRRLRIAIAKLQHAKDQQP